MLDQFTSYTQQHNLFGKNDKIIVAVSGGIDSVVLLDLMNTLKNELTIAHCNFNLRGKESDDDQKFTEDLAKGYSLKICVKSFNTKKYADDNRISIQMAARDLRYSWFEELRTKLKYDYIGIAHNLNDVVETFFINLLRGTGIRGVSGIRPKVNHIIRPLLFATRTEVEKYAEKHHISFRNDSSNDQIKYKRNFIRHEILPQFEKLNTAFLYKMQENIAVFNELGNVINERVSRFIATYVSSDRDVTRIKIEGIIKEKISPEILYEILYEYHFDYSTVRDIHQSLHKESGKIFLSKKYKLLKDREYLIVMPIKNPTDKEYIIQENDAVLDSPIHLRFRKIKRHEMKTIPEGSEMAVLDLDKIRYPLVLRRWKKGDFFYPLGMNHKKKLSDFFIDTKHSVFDKENTWILTSHHDIMWIIGQRIDNRFKITDETTNVLIAEYTGED